MRIFTLSQGMCLSKELPVQQVLCIMWLQVQLESKSGPLFYAQIVWWKPNKAIWHSWGTYCTNSFPRMVRKLNVLWSVTRHIFIFVIIITLGQIHNFIRQFAIKRYYFLYVTHIAKLLSSAFQFQVTTNQHTRKTSIICFISNIKIFPCMFVSYRLHRYIASHDKERMIHWNANALELQQSSTKSAIIDMYVYCLQLSTLNFSLADYVVCILAAYIHHESNKSYYPKYKYICIKAGY